MRSQSLTVEAVSLAVLFLDYLLVFSSRLLSSSSLLVFSPRLLSSCSLLVFTDSLLVFSPRLISSSSHLVLTDSLLVFSPRLISFLSPRLLSSSSFLVFSPRLTCRHPDRPTSPWQALRPWLHAAALRSTANAVMLNAYTDSRGNVEDVISPNKEETMASAGAPPCSSCWTAPLRSH